MEFLDTDVKKMSSLSYTQYFKGVQSHECEDCKTVIHPDMGYCMECVEDNLKPLSIFCCECKEPIKDKTDYFLNNNDVSELPQVYLLCDCSKGLWLPLVKDLMPFGNLNGRVLTLDNWNKGGHWHLCNPNPSKYVSNNEVYFTKCQKKEEDFFLRSYIKANIDPDQRMGSDLESLSKDYYKLCSDTINLNLKLGLLNIFLDNKLGYYLISMNSGLENSINDLVQYSSPIFWADYVSTYFDSCIVRIYRLMDEFSQENTNSYHRYRNRYLRHYPQQESKSGICKIDPRLSEIRKQYTAHDDTQFNTEVLQEGLAILYDFYTDKVLKSINTLNKMQGLKIVFSYDPRKTFLDKGLARPILKIIDNELERYKHEASIPAPEIVERRHNENYPC